MKTERRQQQLLLIHRTEPSAFKGLSTLKIDFLATWLKWVSIYFIFNIIHVESFSGTKICFKQKVLSFKSLDVNLKSTYITSQAKGWFCLERLWWIQAFVSLTIFVHLRKNTFIISDFIQNFFHNFKLVNKPGNGLGLITPCRQFFGKTRKLCDSSHFFLLLLLFQKDDFHCSF